MCHQGRNMYYTRAFRHPMRRLPGNWGVLSARSTAHIGSFNTAKERHRKNLVWMLRCDTALYLPHLCRLHLCNVKSLPVPPYLVARPPVSALVPRASHASTLYQTKLYKFELQPILTGVLISRWGKSRLASISASILITAVPCSISNHR